MAYCTSGYHGQVVTVIRQLKCSISEIYSRWSDWSTLSPPRRNPFTSVKALVLFLVLLVPTHVSAQRDLTRHVNPFIGTGGHGHVSRCDRSVRHGPTQS